MDQDYSTFFSSVNLLNDRIEIKVNDIMTVEHLLDSAKDFKSTNTFKDKYHGVDYWWKKYKFQQCTFYFIKPEDFTSYYKPRIILLQPTLEMRKKIFNILSFSKTLYWKLSQVEITLDFVFKNEDVSNYADTIKRDLDNATHIVWSRAASSFNYEETRYRVNSNIDDINKCSKPIRIYPKTVNGKEVLRFELMLNNKAAADMDLLFNLDANSIFKYIRFYKNTFDARAFASLTERLQKKGADIVRFKKVTSNFANRTTYTINEKIIKIKKLVKELLPEYKVAKSISNCLVEDTELTTFILNNLHIKGV